MPGTPYNYFTNLVTEQVVTWIINDREFLPRALNYARLDASQGPGPLPGPVSPGGAPEDHPSPRLCDYLRGLTAGGRDDGRPLDGKALNRTAVASTAAMDTTVDWVEVRNHVLATANEGPLAD